MTAKTLPERLAWAQDKYSRAQVKVRLLEDQLNRANKKMRSAGLILDDVEYEAEKEAHRVAVAAGAT